MMMKQQDEWEIGIDAQFVHRLVRRQHRPGVWNQRVAQQLIARHTRNYIEHELSARLNRRWQALDEEMSAPVPIVYATPAVSVVLIKHSGDTVQQTVINSQQSSLGNEAVVSPTQPSRSTANSSIVTPRQAQAFSSTPPASEVANTSVTGTPKQVSAETAVSKTTSIRTPPLPLRASPASPSQPQVVNQPSDNAPPLPLVTAQPPPPQTADFTLLPNAPRQSPSANQPVKVETVPGNMASATPLPLVTVQPPPAQTAVSPSNQPQQVSQPPSWMKKQVASQTMPDADVNIDTLTNKVEKQLLQRLLIQRERRGKA